MPRNKKRQQKKNKFLRMHAAAALADRERTFEDVGQLEEPQQQPEPGPPTSAEVWSQYQTVVKCRTVLEFALLSLVVPQSQTSTAVPPTMPDPNPTGSAQKGGWERLMNPVQDLGRSLLNFLVGGSNNGQQPETGSNSGQGRQRPVGHPANPSTHSTPIILRRRTSGTGTHPSMPTPKAEHVSRLEEEKVSESPPPAPVTRNRKRQKNSLARNTEEQTAAHVATPHAVTAPVTMPVLKKVDMSPSCSFTGSSSFSLPFNIKTGPLQQLQQSAVRQLSTSAASAVTETKKYQRKQTEMGNQNSAQESRQGRANERRSLTTSQRRDASCRSQSNDRRSKPLPPTPLRETSHRHHSSERRYVSSSDAAMPDRLSTLIASSSEEAFFTATSTTPRNSLLFAKKSESTSVTSKLREAFLSDLTKNLTPMEDGATNVITEPTALSKFYGKALVSNTQLEKETEKQEDTEKQEQKDEDKVMENVKSENAGLLPHCDFKAENAHTRDRKCEESKVNITSIKEGNSQNLQVIHQTVDVTFSSRQQSKSVQINVAEKSNFSSPIQSINHAEKNKNVEILGVENRGNVKSVESTVNVSSQAENDSMKSETIILPDIQLSGTIKEETGVLTVENQNDTYLSNTIELNSDIASVKKPSISSYVDDSQELSSEIATSMSEMASSVADPDESRSEISSIDKSEITSSIAGLLSSDVSSTDKPEITSYIADSEELSSVIACTEKSVVARTENYVIACTEKSVVASTDKPEITSSISDSKELSSVIASADKSEITSIDVGPEDAEEASANFEKTSTNFQTFVSDNTINVEKNLESENLEVVETPGAAPESKSLEVVESPNTTQEQIPNVKIKEQIPTGEVKENIENQVLEEDKQDQENFDICDPSALSEDKFNNEYICQLNESDIQTQEIADKVPFTEESLTNECLSVLSEQDLPVNPVCAEKAKPIKPAVEQSDTDLLVEVEEQTMENSINDDCYVPVSYKPVDHSHAQAETEAITTEICEQVEPKNSSPLESLVVEGFNQSKVELSNLENSADMKEVTDVNSDPSEPEISAVTQDQTMMEEVPAEMEENCLACDPSEKEKSVKPSVVETVNQEELEVPKPDSCEPNEQDETLEHKDVFIDVSETAESSEEIGDSIAVEVPEQVSLVPECFAELEAQGEASKDDDLTAGEYDHDKTPVNEEVPERADSSDQITFVNESANAESTARVFISDVGLQTSSVTEQAKEKYLNQHLDTFPSQQKEDEMGKVERTQMEGVCQQTVKNSSSTAEEFETHDANENSLESSNAADVTSLRKEKDTSFATIETGVDDLSEQKETEMANKNEVENFSESNNSEAPKIDESDNSSNAEQDKFCVTTAVKVVDSSDQEKDRYSKEPHQQNSSCAIPAPPPPPPPGYLTCQLLADKKVEKKEVKKRCTAEQALLKQLESLNDDTFVGFLKSNLPAFRNSSDENPAGRRNRTSKRPNSQRISESENASQCTPTPSSSTPADAPHLSEAEQISGDNQLTPSSNEGEKGAPHLCHTLQNVAVNDTTTTTTPSPIFGAECSTAEISAATKIEGGGGQQVQEQISVDKKSLPRAESVKEKSKRELVKVVCEKSKETFDDTMRQKGEINSENNVNSSKIKSDLGFADSVAAEDPHNKNNNKVENVKAIFKSDSGFSEASPSEEDDLLAPGAKVKAQISVEQAHTLFEKRYSAMLGQDDSTLFGGSSSAVSETCKSSNLTKVATSSNAIDQEDSDEYTDDDETDEDSEDDIKGDVLKRRLNGPTTPATAALSQVGEIGQSSSTSRRSSTDSSEEGFNLNVKGLKHDLREVEEKFRQAMVANAGLDNEKSSLTYQVELLKDQLEEVEEQTALVSKELREKSRDFELLKRQHADAQRAVQLLQLQLDEQSRLLTERGMVLVGDEGSGDDDEVESEGRHAGAVREQEQRTRAIVSAETASILSVLGKGPLDVRIKRLAEERDDLQDQVRRLKLDLEDEKNRNERLERSTPEEVEWETKRLIDDYKFKLQKCEQDINTLQTNVARLETQVTRFQSASETAERSEEELKTERRKLQRELREATTRVEELETANNHLETRLGKLKTAKSNLLKDL